MAHNEGTIQWRWEEKRRLAGGSHVLPMYPIHPCVLEAQKKYTTLYRNRPNLEHQSPLIQIRLPPLAASS